MNLLSITKSRTKRDYFHEPKEVNLSEQKQSNFSGPVINIASIKILLIAVSFFLNANRGFSQDITEMQVKTDVNEVTVFVGGAQVSRKKTLTVPQGISILKFVNLSPFIDAKSVQVKAGGSVTVLSVNHQQNFLGKIGKPQELTDLESKLEQIENNLKLERTYLEILAEELSFLKDNRDLGGSKEINVATLKEASVFYGSSLRTLKLKQIEHNNNILNLENQRFDIENQIKTLTSKKEYPTGEILVKVNGKKPASVNFEISYMVNNASWFPSYDIRARSISEPVELVYKANVQQDTKEDWKNVRLRFSSSDPDKTNIAPQLKTYFLSYNSTLPVYNRITGSVNGKIFDISSGEGLPGVNVVVEGTLIGTVTDANGNYSITIPNSSVNLVFSYVGYLTQIIPVSGKVMNVSLAADFNSLQEVVVTGYGTQKKNITGALSGMAPGLQVKRNEDIKIRGVSNMVVPTQKVEKQTVVNFEIKEPYTVLSDNKSYSVVMENYELPASYQYYSVPGIDRDAFLIAHIVNWEKYSLLEGEANIFFEDTYVGKSLLDVRYADDTLKVSLGRDKNVSITREKAKEFTTKQFIGNKKEEARQWVTTVRNNKGQKISILVIDQVPVSTVQDIEVEVQKSSGAALNAETGEVRWEFTLDPQEKKVFDLRYTVKYPKYQNLVLE